MVPITRADAAQMDFSDICESERLAPITPGQILCEEFIVPLQFSARALARDLGVPPNRVSEIINRTCANTAETAILLARRLKTTPRFWMNLQISYDLMIAEQQLVSAA